MNKFYFWGPLLYQTKVDEEDLKNIKLLCKKEKENNHNTKLAGHLSNQYSIDRYKYVAIINKYFVEFSKTFENFYSLKYKPMNCNNAWVNFMTNGEFNPPHIHSDCDFSSVLYLDIPKELQDEAKNYVGTLGLQGAPGSISFFYGEQGKFVLDSVSFFPTKGDFFIFPATLRHSVSPFKSKVERISIAANFKVDITDKDGK
jgi:uncharacterized protein (TIGR02466 family)